MTANSPWLLYILRCRDGSLYTGITKDLDARLEEHRRGTGAKYLRGRTPFTVVYLEQGHTHRSAARREHQIKKLPRKAKLAIINRLSAD